METILNNPAPLPARQNPPAHRVQASTEQAFQEACEREDLVRRFMAERMREGVDYGFVPGAKSNKPSLFQEGARRLMGAFHLASHITRIDRIFDIENEFVAYEVTVAMLNKQTGCLEGEGVGLCNSGENRYKNQNALNIANTILKMGKKRGLIDAVIDATGASTLFEAEDAEGDDGLGDPDAPPARPAARRERSGGRATAPTRPSNQQTAQPSRRRQPLPSEQLFAEALRKGWAVENGKVNPNRLFSALKGGGFMATAINAENIEQARQVLQRHYSGKQAR